MLSMPGTPEFSIQRKRGHGQIDVYDGSSAGAGKHTGNHSVEVADHLRYYRTGKHPDPDAEHVASAKATFGILREITQDAAETVEYYQRYECAWNNHVHGPLLKLAFASRIMSATILRPSRPTVRARWEAIMSATIAGDSIPCYQSFAADSSSVHFACSVTNLTDGDAASIDSGVSLTELQSRKDSKKVHFADVLDVAENEPLRGTVAELINYVSVTTGSAPHVNQTIYRPLKYRPIVVSIETKAQSVKDPLIQLSIWTAA